MSNNEPSALLETLLERLQQREDLELEFKRAQGGLPSSIWETVSAFANTNGGWILLGVDDSKSPPEITGISNPVKLTTDIFNIMRNPNKLSHPVCGALDVSTEDVGSRHLIVIRVPASPRRNRPVYINGNPYQGTYVRRHDGDFRCTKPEVDRMMRDASDVAADSAVLKNFSMDDLDGAALARYRRMYQTAHPASPWNGYDDQRFLQAIGAYRHDRESGDTGITVAGLLLLGTPLSLREWRRRHLIDYRELRDDASLEDRWKNRIPWEGNLFEAFETLYPPLTSDLPIPFQLQGATRTEQGPFQIALREALVNLLVHADYAESDASLITRSSDGFLFRNPGSSRVTTYDLLTGDRSDPRNPELVKMFRHIGWAEEAGTGIAKIVAAWRKLGLKLPKIDIGTDRYEFSLVLRYAHLFSDDDRSWLLSLGENWSEAEQIALVYARHEDFIDNATLRGLTGLHAADATKLLGNLRDRQLLEMTGLGRGTSYVLGPTAAMAASASSMVNGSNSGDSESSFRSNEPSSRSNEPSSGNVHSELQRISQAARARERLTPKARDHIITELCTVAPLSIAEIAQWMNRSTDSVRDAVRRLIASGYLFPLYPDRPTHPKQKYLATEHEPSAI